MVNLDKSLQMLRKALLLGLPVFYLLTTAVFAQQKDESGWKKLRELEKQMVVEKDGKTLGWWEHDWSTVDEKGIREGLVTLAETTPDTVLKAEAYSQLGNSYIHFLNRQSAAGTDVAKAKEAYFKSLEANPNNENAQSNVGWALTPTERKDLAVEKKYPYLLSYIRAANGWDINEKGLEEIAAANPDNAEAQSFVAGKSPEATKAFVEKFSDNTHLMSMVFNQLAFSKLSPQEADRLLELIYLRCKAREQNADFLSKVLSNLNEPATRTKYGIKTTQTGVPDYGLVTIGANAAFIQVPSDYTPDKKYPLIIFLHGRGGNVSNNNFLSEEFTAFRKKTKENGYIVAVPGYGSDNWMNKDGEQIVLETIDFLRGKISLDNKRLYIMGVSMGGGGALTFAVRHPDVVAAVCDLIGVTDFTRFYNEGFYRQSLSNAFGGSPQEKPEVYRERSSFYHTDILKNLPVLIIHGDNDKIVPFWNSELLYEKLKEEKGKVEFVKVSGGEHSNSIVIGLEDKILNFFSSWTK